MALHISPQDRARVTRAITKAEKSTSGEIIVVATAQSDDYIHVPIHIAAGLALAVPLVLPFVARFLPWEAISHLWVYVAQLATFIVAALILSLDPLRYLVTPKSLMRKYASRYAASQFLTMNMHGTGGRTGVLIFVSVLERHCEVIGDTAIAAKVSNAMWQDIVDEMLPAFRDGRIADGLVHGVERCGAVLAQHFPPGKVDPNELPDRFIVLE
jgi:putative membrane protein